jgi:hypothetical protein
VAKWRCHHSRIGDDHVKRLSLADQAFGAGADALQVRKIERDQLEATTVRSSILLHLCGRGLGFYQIPRRSYDVHTVCRKSLAVSTPIPADTPVTRIRFPCRSTPDKTSSVVELAPNIFFISLPLSSGVQPVHLFEIGNQPRTGWAPLQPFLGLRA